MNDIDLYCTHVYDAATPLEETLGALTDRFREDKVCHIGCSNITTDQMRRAARISGANGLAAYAAMQQEYAYLHPRAEADQGVAAHGDADMLAFAARHDMAFLAYSPLLKGIYGSRERWASYYNGPLYESEQNRCKLALVDEMAATRPRRVAYRASSIQMTWASGTCLARQRMHRSETTWALR